MSINKTVTSGIVIDNDDTDDLNSGSNRNKISPRKLSLLIALGLAVVGGGVYGGVAYVKGHLSFFNAKNEELTKTRRSYAPPPESIGKYTPPPLELTSIEEEEDLAAEPETSPVQEMPDFAPPVINQANTSAQEPTGDQPPSLTERRLSAGVSGYTGSISTGADDNGQTATVSTRQVKLLKNIDYTLIKGTKIPCTMESNIISEQDGFTSCVINQDVYSGNARVLLIEKGTKVTGEYRGSVKNGDRRLNIVWDRLITPYDIVVQLDSPSTDRLGAAGVTGEVDNRWGLRIGSALLVSLISDVISIAADNSDSAEVIVDSDTSDTSQDLAERILEKNIDLSPIIYIREGEMINIYVADDIDMSGVYNVRKRHGVYFGEL